MNNQNPGYLFRSDTKTQIPTLNQDNSINITFDLAININRTQCKFNLEFEFFRLNFNSSSGNQCDLLTYHNRTFGKDCQFIGLLDNTYSEDDLGRFLSHQFNPNLKSINFLFYKHSGQIMDPIDNESKYKQSYNKNQENSLYKLEHARAIVETQTIPGGQQMHPLEQEVIFKEEEIEQPSIMGEYILINNTLVPVIGLKVNRYNSIECLKTLPKILLNFINNPDFNLDTITITNLKRNGIEQNPSDLNVLRQIFNQCVQITENDINDNQYIQITNQIMPTEEEIERQRLESEQRQRDRLNEIQERNRITPEKVYNTYRNKINESNDKKRFDNEKIEKTRANIDIIKQNILSLLNSNNIFNGNNEYNTNTIYNLILYVLINKIITTNVKGGIDYNNIFLTNLFIRLNIGNDSSKQKLIKNYIDGLIKVNNKIKLNTFNTYLPNTIKPSDITLVNSNNRDRIKENISNFSYEFTNSNFEITEPDSFETFINRRNNNNTNDTEGNPSKIARLKQKYLKYKSKYLELKKQMQNLKL